MSMVNSKTLGGGILDILSGKISKNSFTIVTYSGLTISSYIFEHCTPPQFQSHMLGAKHVLVQASNFFEHLTKLI